MNILYTKSFSKDLDAIRHESKTKERLLDLIGQIKRVDTLSDISGVKKRRGLQVISGFGLVIIGLE